MSSIWNSVLHKKEELKEKILSYKPKVEDFFLFREELIQNNFSNYLDAGFKKIIIHQISYSGLGVKSGGPLGGVKQESIYKIDCRWSPEYMCKKIDYFHSLLKEKNISDNECTSVDFEKIVCVASKDSFIYLDPPYFDKGNELYQCSMSFSDHKRLSELLKNTQAKWLLSYDNSEIIRHLYKWANIEEIDINYTIRGSRGKRELLIYA